MAVAKLAETVALHEVADEVGGNLDVGTFAQIVAFLGIEHAAFYHRTESGGLYFEESVVNLRVVAFGIFDDFLVAVTEAGIDAHHVKGHQERLVSFGEEIVVHVFNFVMNTHKTLGQQLLFIGEGFIKRPFGDMQLLCDVVHCHPFTAAAIEHL